MRNSRRDFLRQSALTVAGAAAASLPTIVSPRAFAAKATAAPSDRIRLGFIGVGNRGGQNLDGFLKLLAQVDVVGRADVDSSHLKNALGKVQSKAGRACPSYGDYRKSLENKD